MKFPSPVRLGQIRGVMDTLNKSSCAASRSFLDLSESTCLRLSLASRALIVSVGLLVSGITSPIYAQWLPTAGGSYSYNDPGNWNGGTVNSQFNTPTTGPQTVTFAEDVLLPTGVLNFENLANGPMTWQSDTGGVSRHLTLGSSVVTFQVKVGTLTIGTNTNPLVLELGTNTTILLPNSTGSIVLNAKLTGGASDKYLSIGNSSSQRGSVYLNNDSNDFVANLRIQRIDTFQVASVADAGVASAIGAGSAIRFEHSSGTAKFNYVGSGHSTNRTIELASSSSVEIWNSGTGKLTFSGNFNRTGSENASLYFRGNQEIDVTGKIGDSTGSGRLGLFKLGSNTLLLSGDNEFSGGMTIAEGKVRAGHSAALGSGAVDLRANATLSVDRAVNLKLGSLKTANNSHLSFDLGDGADRGTLTINGDLIEGGTVVVNLTGGAGLADGTYTLVTVLGDAADVNFTLGQGFGDYNFDLTWQNQTLSVTVASIPENSTTAAILGGAAIVAIMARRQHR